MKDDEANRIISEFMGNNYFTFEHPDGEAIEVHSMNPLHSGTMPISYNWYTKSLDALVPVWEKLNSKTVFRYDLLQLPSDNWYFQIDKYKHEAESYRYYLEDTKATIQQAAAHATSKAILELKK